MSMLGFASCTNGGTLDSDEDPMTRLLAYGPPAAEYKFHIEVGDEAGKPIPGIQVVVAPFGLNQPTEKNDTLYTDAAGKAGTELRAAFIDNKNIQVELTDVDGPENGSFRMKVLRVDELDIREERKASYAQTGLYSITAKTQMKAKKE